MRLNHWIIIKIFHIENFSQHIIVIIAFLRTLLFDVVKTKAAFDNLSQLNRAKDC